MKARAYWATAKGQGSIREQSLEPAREGQLLLKTRYSAISRGTELLVAKGLIPVTEYERMQCPFQEGRFPFPVKYGYNNLARIVAGPASKINRFVFTLFPHQDFFTVDETQAYIVPLDIPLQRVLLAANMETALNIIWDSRVSIGDRVVVIGAGAVGLLLVSLLTRMPGIETLVIDKNGQKKKTVQNFGADFSTDIAAPWPADIIINTSGSAQVLGPSLELAGKEGLIIEASWHGSNQVCLPLGGAFHSKRLTIRSSQVGSLPPDRQPRFDYRRRMNKALELIKEDSRLDCLITGKTSFEELPQLMPMLANSMPDTICHLIDYGE